MSYASTSIIISAYYFTSSAKGLVMFFDCHFLFECHSTMFWWCQNMKILCRI